MFVAVKPSQRARGPGFRSDMPATRASLLHGGRIIARQKADIMDNGQPDVMRYVNFGV
jgi:hypothetical protein